MRPSSAKNKGRRLQQKVAQSILEAFPHLTPDDCFSTSMGCQGEDIRLSSAARKSVPLSFECKCQERLNVWSSLEQATSNSGESTPCLVFSRNRSPTYAVVPWDFLLSLLKERARSASEGRLPERVVSLVKELHEHVVFPSTHVPLPAASCVEEEEGMQAVDE